MKALRVSISPSLFAPRTSFRSPRRDRPQHDNVTHRPWLNYLADRSANGGKLVKGLLGTNAKPTKK